MNLRVKLKAKVFIYEHQDKNLALVSIICDNTGLKYKMNIKFDIFWRFYGPV